MYIHSDQDMTIYRTTIPTQVTQVSQTMACMTCNLGRSVSDISEDGSSEEATVPPKAKARSCSRSLSIVQTSFPEVLRFWSQILLPTRPL